MRKFLFFVLIILFGIGIILFALFSPRKTIKIEKEKDVFKPESLIWKKVELPIPWSPRDSHGVVVYQNKIWLMGGLNGNGFVIQPGMVKYGEALHFSDVWVSEDGMNWNLVTENAPWGKRRSIEVVVFKEKMWLIPGWGPFTGLKSEIWTSEDGKNWTKIIPNQSWSPREGIQLVVFKNKLCLIGGVNYEKREIKNDVWCSEDGINWFEVASSTPWAPRWDHKVIEFKGKLWLIGGMDLKGNIFADVWVSEDGKDWKLVTDNPPWEARQGHGVVVYRDKIWIIGRFNSKDEGGKNDVWFSDDGINWKKTKKDPPWLGREDFGVVVFQDKIWIFGGMTTDWSWQNDIWYSDFPL